MTEETLTIPEELCHASPFFDALAKSDMKNEVSSEVATIVAFHELATSSNIKMYEINQDYMFYLTALVTNQTGKMLRSMNSWTYQLKLLKKSLHRWDEVMSVQQNKIAHDVILVNNVMDCWDIADATNETLFMFLLRNASDMSIKSYNYKLLCKLLEPANCRMSLNQVDLDGNSVLMHLVCNSSYDNIRQCCMYVLETKQNCLPGQVNKFGDTVALCAAMTKKTHFEIILTKLINAFGNECKLDQIGSEETFLLLELCWRRASIELINLVLSYDWIPKTNTKYWLEMLFCECCKDKKYSFLAEWIITNHDINCNTTDMYGLTPLYYTRKNKMDTITQLILQKVVTINDGF
jgi:hypothetical protein